MWYHNQKIIISFDMKFLQSFSKWDFCLRSSLIKFYSIIIIIIIIIVIIMFNF